MRSEVIQGIIDYPFHFINDISGGDYDREMWDICSKEHLAYVMMHMQGMPNTMQLNPTYDDVSFEILVELRNRVIEARETNGMIKR